MNYYKFIKDRQEGKKRRTDDFLKDDILKDRGHKYEGEEKIDAIEEQITVKREQQEKLKKLNTGPPRRRRKKQKKNYEAQNYQNQLEDPHIADLFQQQLDEQQAQPKEASTTDTEPTRSLEPTRGAAARRKRRRKRIEPTSLWDES